MNTRGQRVINFTNSTLSIFMRIFNHIIQFPQIFHPFIYTVGQLFAANMKEYGGR